MGLFSAMLANKLRNRLLGGAVDGSSNDPVGSPDSSGGTQPPASNFQMPGFWQSLVDHKLGIDELAPLKAQLLDSQIKEQQLRNARFGIDAQHQDTMFGLASAEGQLKNENASMTNAITKATMANAIETSNLNLGELQSKVAGTDTESMQKKALTGYYNSLTSENQLKLAQSFAEASAGTQIGPADVGSLTDSFIKNSKVDPSQVDAAKSFFGPAIAGSLAQKQQQLDMLRKSNDAATQAKNTNDYKELVNLFGTSTDPRPLAAGAKLLGYDPQVIDAALQAAPTIRQPMVTPREDAVTKGMGENLTAQQGTMTGILSNAGVSSPDQLKPKDRKKYDTAEALYNSIYQKLQEYSQNAPNRQVSKRAAPQSFETTGGPGVTRQRPMSTTRANLGTDPSTLPDAILQVKESDYPMVAKRWGLTVDQIKTEVLRRQNAGPSHEEGQ